MSWAVIELQTGLGSFEAWQTAALNLDKRHWQSLRDSVELHRVCRGPLPRLLWHEWPRRNDRNCYAWVAREKCKALGKKKFHTVLLPGWLVRSAKHWERKKLHTCGGPRRGPCLGYGRGRRILHYFPILLPSTLFGVSCRDNLH